MSYALEPRAFRPCGYDLSTRALLSAKSEVNKMPENLVTTGWSCTEASTAEYDWSA